MSPSKVAPKNVRSANDSRKASTTSKAELRNSEEDDYEDEDFEDYDDDDDDDDWDEKGRPHSKANTQNNLGPTFRAILPQIINEQNRKTFGTWQRQLDFTRTILGYLLGLHNFFRFPYLCYKFGGVFFLPYVLMMLIVGVPAIFMEFTIGQYYGVGSYVAFTHMSPILGGVSKLLTWSCALNCWMYTVILAWIRVYSNDVTSCIKGWEICHEPHYYNTPHCYTGALDDGCNDPSSASANGLPVKFVIENDLIFYNFQCRSIDYYCKSHGWTQVPGKKLCRDSSSGKYHSVYERRIHAIEEYFFGAVLGLQRFSEIERNDVLVSVTLMHSGYKNVTDLVDEIHMGKNVSKERITNEKKFADPREIVRQYLNLLKSDPAKKPLYNKIKDAQASQQYQDKYWSEEGQRLQVDETSNSGKELQQLSMTTWIMIAVFLFEDLLKVSFLSYILNAVPFLILIYVSTIVVNFEYSGYAIEHLFFWVKEGLFKDLANTEIWCEAVIQVIYTTGIGNGVLISLATFNNLTHNYLTDLFLTMGLTMTTSCCGVLITFCTIGQYLKQYDIDVPFRQYIEAQSLSSVEFCLIVYSHFLTLISDQSVTIMLFFFMLNSFATDTAIRLAQSVLDTVMDMSARFKPHSAMVLVAVCSMGYLMMVPMMRNGSYVFFVDIEYFATRYAVPTIVLIEIGACVFVYKASRIVDHAEQMCVFESYSFRICITGCMYLSFFVILLTILLNCCNHTRKRFSGMTSDLLTEIFGWGFFATPIIMIILFVAKQLMVVPRYRWGWLMMPLKGKDRKAKRAFLRRIQGGRQGKSQNASTTQDEIRQAAVLWRQLEANLMLRILAKRNKAKKDKERRDSNRMVGVALSNSNLLAVEPGSPGERRGSRIDGKRRGSRIDGERRGSRIDGERRGSRIDGERRGSRIDGERRGSKKDGEIPKQVELEEKHSRHTMKSGSSDGGEAEAFPVIERRTRRFAFIHVATGGCMSKLAAAFLGKAMGPNEKGLRPKRHSGGPRKKGRLVTTINERGEKTVRLEEADDDDESEESEESQDAEEKLEKKRISYLNLMDYWERWPGRLDESEIESEGSSMSDLEHSDEEEYY